jgi:signal recognition particle subunit SRP72
MSASRKTTLYSEIWKASQNSDYEKAVKSCNRLLHEYPEEVTAFESKMVCYIHLSKFQEAIEFMDKNPKLSGGLNFEKSYCYYRLGRLDEAKETLESTEDSLRKKELMSQILYRLESYEKCFDMYKEVIKGSIDDYDNERQTNLAAICACLSLVGSNKQTPNLPVDSYEMAYNGACILAAKGEYAKAEVLLTKAEELCVEILKEDGLSDEEIDEELAIIRIQKAFCLQMLGKEKEALSAYLRVLKGKPTDVSLVAVASNNVLCLNRDQNIFESKKRLKAMLSGGAKLNREQKRNMIHNQILFFLHTGQNNQCLEGIQKYMEVYPEATENAGLLKTAIHAKIDGTDQAKKYAEDFIKKNPKSATKIQLGLIQEILREGKRDEAIALLKEMLKNSYDLGIISALVVLYQGSNNIQAAADVLKDAIQYFKRKNDKSVMNMLWRQSAALLMQTGDYAEAVKSLEELLKATPEDMVTLAQTVLACAQFDMAKAQKLSKSLPPPPQDPSLEDLELEGTETLNWLTNPKVVKKPGGKGDVVTPPGSARKSGTSPSSDSSTSDDIVTPVKTKKKKKKKTKLPKNCDPTQDVDPERWLPKYARTGYKPKKVRKARVDVAKGTQGTAGGQDAAFDMSGRVGNGAKASASTTGVPPSPSVGPKSASASKSVPNLQTPKSSSASPTTSGASRSKKKR